MSLVALLNLSSSFIMTTNYRLKVVKNKIYTTNVVRTLFKLCKTYINTYPQQDCHLKRWEILLDYIKRGKEYENE